MKRMMVLGLLGSLSLMATGSAVAGGGPRTDDVVAVFDLAPISSTGFTCDGVDGLYFEFQDVFLGSVVSDDSRLDGEMTTRTHSLLNLDTGQSDILGVFEIRDPVSGIAKVSGHVTAVGGPGAVARGLLTGRLSAGGQLIANVSIETNVETGEIHGELGGEIPSMISDLAIIQSGSCRS